MVATRNNWPKYSACEFLERNERRGGIRTLFKTNSKSAMKIWLNLNQLEPDKFNISSVVLSRNPSRKAHVAKSLLREKK